MRTSTFVTVGPNTAVRMEEHSVVAHDEEADGSFVHLRCATSTDAHRMEAAFRALRERLAEGEAAAREAKERRIATLERVTA